MIRGGGEKSLWSVCRKDCGKQGMQHPWSLAPGWGELGDRLTCKLQVWGGRGGVLVGEVYG